MPQRSHKSKTTKWSALVAGLLLFAFGVAMFALMLWSKGILDASPYLVAVLGGIYVGSIPWRRARIQAKGDSPAKR